MNLITDQWIPVIRKKDKKQVLIKPAELTHLWEKDPILALDAPRPDFNGALIQFLIGIIQTAMPPADEEEWLERYLHPPDLEELSKVLDKKAEFFELEDEQHPFMQDITSNKIIPIGHLLIDSPGDNTLKENRDHFIKRGVINQICPCCAALALYTLQLNAPAGGRGHLTSLRGGGPLTTIAVPDPKQEKYATLWHTVWLNILTKEGLKRTKCSLRKNKPGDIFPWVEEIKTSENPGSETTPDDISPFQTYWGMPRRIKLVDPEGKGVCDICGQESTNLITSCKSRTYGIKYADGIRHPLSPYYKNNEGLRLSQHPQPGGFTYRYWPQFINSNDSDNPRAIVLETIDDKLDYLMSEGIKQKVFIELFGYDMNKDKARCWYESIMPYWLIQDDMIRSNVVSFANKMAEAASAIASNTRAAVKSAWIDSGSKAKGDLSYIENEFWSLTEDSFYDKIDRIVKIFSSNKDSPMQQLEDWHKELNRCSLSIFDRYSEQISLTQGNENGVPRVIKARKDLGMFNVGKKIRIEILGLPEKRSKKGDKDG